MTAREKFAARAKAQRVRVKMHTAAKAWRSSLEAKAEKIGLVSAEKLAGILGLQLKAFYERVRRGTIKPAARIDGRIWFDPDQAKYIAPPRGKKAPEGYISRARFAELVGVSIPAARQVCKRYGVITTLADGRIWMLASEVERVKIERSLRGKAGHRVSHRGTAEPALPVV